MNYRVMGLSPAQFRPYFTAPDDTLAAQSIIRSTVDMKPGYPCRVSLVDAQPGETVVLLNYIHQPASTPFRSSHGIYVREVASAAFDAVGVLPEAFAIRTMSLRAFDASGMLLDADLGAGSELEPLIARLLSNRNVAYLHAHYAKAGCYAGRIERSERPS